MPIAALLRANRNFRRYWSAGLISTLGSAVSAIAVPLVALTLSGVTFAGLIGSCSLVTRLLFRFPAGQLADRYDRRWLMLATDLIRTVLLGSVPLAAAAGQLHYGLLLVVALGESVASAIFAAANGIALRDVVADEELTDALSGNQAANSVVMLLGPVIGGYLFGLGRIVPFAVDAMSYLISAVLLFGLARPSPKAIIGSQSDPRLLAGLYWLRRQTGLLWVLGFACIINLVDSCLTIGLVISLRAQGEPGSRIGMVIACAGAGSIVGALSAHRLIAVVPPGPLFLATGLLWTAGLAALASQPNLVVVCVVLLLLTLLFPAEVIVLGKAVLLSCPRNILARVNSAIGTGLMALASLGPALISFVISKVGVADAWLALAALAMLVSVIAGRRLINLRSLVALAAPDHSTQGWQATYGQPSER